MGPVLRRASWRGPPNVRGISGALARNSAMGLLNQLTFEGVFTLTRGGTTAFGIFGAIRMAVARPR